MLAAERIVRINDRLAKTGAVKVDALASEFGVSEMTIRRDLEKCLRSGKVQRCYGGAFLKSEIEPEAAYEDKQSKNRQGKVCIADHAAALVEEGMAVFLDAGTTTLELAKKLGAKPNLTVVTNDLEIALALRKSSADLIMLGGLIQKTTGCTFDDIAKNNLASLRVDLAFLGVMSIDSDFDTFTPTIEKAAFKRAVMNIAGHTYLLADSDKFYRRSLFKVNNLCDYTALVTDRAFDPAELEAMRDKEINVIVAEKPPPHN